MSICGRCYDEVNQLFPANCEEKPELLKGEHLGCTRPFILERIKTKEIDSIYAKWE